MGYDPGTLNHGSVDHQHSNDVLNQVVCEGHGVLRQQKLMEAGNAIRHFKVAETTAVGHTRFDVLNVPRQAAPNSGVLCNVESNRE